MFPHMSVEKMLLNREAGFPLDLLDIWGGGKCKGQSVNGGEHAGGAWTLWEDPALIDYIRLYHKLKVLLLLLLLLLC